jgi:hypothetical protein
MTVTILFVALVVFAFFAAHLINRYASRVLPLSGAEYLVIGVLIGPHVPPHVLTTEALARLAPVVSLLLGLNGFLVGLQAPELVREPRLTLAGFATAGTTLLCMAAAFAGLFGWLVPLDEPPFLQKWLFEIRGYNVELLLTRPQAAVALVIAAIATVTFSSTLSGSERRVSSDVPAFRLLRICSFCSQIAGISAVAAVLAWSRSSASARLDAPAIAWFLGVLVLGAALGGCFLLFIGTEQSTSRIFVITIGTVTFGAGIGAELGVSSMFVNLVSGATVGFSLHHRGNLQRELSRLQHPISVLLLMLTGALWVPPAQALWWLFPVAYLPTRWLSRSILPALWTRATTSIAPNRIGVGLLSQGTLAVAVAVDYALQAPESAGIVLSTAIVGTLIFDMVGQRTLERYLVDAEAESGLVSDISWARDGAGT